jgi:4a-hydroxytetrahydrobiopterin dehydratase
MDERYEQVCEPCHRGAPTLTPDESHALAARLDGWMVIDQHHLEKIWTFPDFVLALASANAVGAIAEEQGHHPEIFIAWGRTPVRIWTYKVDGLTQTDFTLAARIDHGRRNSS